MEYLDKIEQLFKANEIVLAVQLCKSQGYDLRDVIQALCKFQENGYFKLNNLRSNKTGIYVYKFPPEITSSKFSAWVYDKNICQSSMDIELSELLDLFTQAIIEYANR